MRREHTELEHPAIGAPGGVIAYGHYGRPLLVLPSEQGRAPDYESNGMVAAVSWLIDAGRVKLYCVDSFDRASWSNEALPLEARARAHDAYEAWIVERVVPFIHGDCGGATEIATTGCSMGAYHAANLRCGAPTCSRSRSACRATTTRRPGTRGASAATRPTSTTRPTTSPTCTATIWSGCVPPQHRVGVRAGPVGGVDRIAAERRRFAALLAEKGLRHELDLWGYDVPHDWPSWRTQLAHHLPRFC